MVAPHALPVKPSGCLPLGGTLHFTVTKKLKYPWTVVLKFLF